MNENVERVLVVYDGSSEEVVSLLRLSNFSLDSLMQQFDVDPESDPQMYNCYAIGPEDISFVLAHLDEELDFDFQKNAYFIEAVANDLH